MSAQDNVLHDSRGTGPRISHNLAVGLASSILVAVIGLAVVPLYLSYLGTEAYGLIGFLVTTQTLVQILDFGLAATISRNVARGLASGDFGEARNLLHTLAMIYWGMAVVIALVVALLASVIGQHWLQSDRLPHESVTHAVMLLGLVIACRWPGQLYQGALMGAQRVVMSSLLNVAMVALGSIGAVGVLAFVSPTIQAFFIWQAGVGLLYVLAARTAAWHVLIRRNVHCDIRQLRQVWQFSAGMTAITASGILFSQLDKVMLSKMLTLAEYGQYMLAVVVAGALYILSTPVFNVMYPRFSALVFIGDNERLADTYRLSTRLLAALLFPVAMLLAVFSEEVVLVWTRDADLARNIAQITSFLVVGSALHGIMHVPFALQLAHARTRLPLLISAILIIAMVPLVLMLVSFYGALGAAFAWLALHALYLLLGGWLTHRYLLKGLALKWLSGDVGVPLTMSALVGLVAHHVSQSSDFNVYIKLAYGVTFSLAAFLLTLVASPRLRFVLFQWTRGRILATFQR